MQWQHFWNLMKRENPSTVSWLQQEKNKDTSNAVRIEKDLYPLEELPGFWNEAVDRTVQCLKFTPCNSDPCLYVRLEQDVKDNLSFPIHVDGLIGTASSSALLELVKQKLMTGLCDRNVIKVKDAVLLYQPTYVVKLLKELQFKTANQSRFLQQWTSRFLMS